LSEQEAVTRLAVLGLRAGASADEVKQAYRDLANVWHPDRFAHNARLQQKAEERLKEINAAFQWLEEHPEALGRATSSPASAPTRPTPRADAGARLLLLALAVVVVTLLGVFLARSGRRVWRVARRDAPVADALARPPTPLPPGWPWRGVTLSSASGAGPGDVARLRATLGAGFDYVRLTLEPRRFARLRHVTPDVGWSEALAWAERMLDACRNAGLTATVTLAEMPLDPALGPTETAPAFWASAEQRAGVVRAAGELAARWAARGPELGAYEVLPRPFVLEGKVAKVPAEWPQLLGEIVATIRARDAGRWIVVTPGPGGRPSGYRDFAALDDPRIVYGAAMYAPVEYTRQGVGHRPGGVAYPGTIAGHEWDDAALERFLHDLRLFAERYRVPVVIDEFSAARWAPGAERYVADLARIFGEYGWGWAYFGYKEGAAWSPDDGAAGDSPRWRTLRAAFDAPASRK
jgi:hypothetical protein